MGMVGRELDETALWLELVKSGIVTVKKLRSLQAETEKLQRITV